MASKYFLVVLILCSLLSSVALHALSVSTSFQERVNEKEIENFVNQLRSERGLRVLSYSPALHQLANNFAKIASKGELFSLDQIREEVNRAGYTRKVHSLVAWGTVQDVKQEWTHTSSLMKVLSERTHHELAVAQEANTWIALFGAELLDESMHQKSVLGAKRKEKPESHSTTETQPTSDPHSKPSTSNPHGNSTAPESHSNTTDSHGSKNSTGGHGSDSGGGHGKGSDKGGHGETTNSTEVEPFAATKLSSVEKAALGLEFFVLVLLVVWLVAATVLGGLTPERVSCLHK